MKKGTASTTAVVGEFEILLNDRGTGEGTLQRYIEEHTEFVPTPFLLNHGLHFDCVISKFAVGPWSADFAYLTKSSDAWRLVLVELETASKQIFKESGLHSPFSAPFNDALAQIHTWRDTLRDDSDEVRRRIAPLQFHMRDNALSFWYLLVIGRDSELRNNTARRKRLAAFLESENLQVMTWDSLIRLARTQDAKKKCVLAEIAAGYRIKRMDAIPSLIFAHVPAAQLSIGEADIQSLKGQGYDMEAWKKGELLTVNDKYPASEFSRLFGKVLEPNKPHDPE